SHKFILRLLGKPDHGQWVHLKAKKFVQGKCRCTFQCRGRRHSRAQGNITAEDAVKSADTIAPGLYLLDDSQNIIRPMKGGWDDLSGVPEIVDPKIQGYDMDEIVIPARNGHIDRLVNGGRHDKSIIIVCMLSDQVDPAG